VRTLFDLFCPGFVLSLVALCVGCSPSAPPVAGGPGPTGSGSTSSRASAEGVSGGESIETIETVALFHDRAAESGIDFSYRNGQEAGYYSIVESLGGGVGLLDLDRDGDLDLFLPGGGRFGKDDTIGGRPSGVFLNVATGSSWTRPCRQGLRVSPPGFLMVPPSATLMATGFPTCW